MQSLVPEDVSDGEAAHSSQAARPAGIPVTAGPHLNDDERQNGGVLEGQSSTANGGCLTKGWDN